MVYFKANKELVYICWRSYCSRWTSEVPEHSSVTVLAKLWWGEAPWRAEMTQGWGFAGKSSATDQRNQSQQRLFLWMTKKNPNKKAIMSHNESLYTPGLMTNSSPCLMERMTGTLRNYSAHARFSTCFFIYFNDRKIINF